jgi:cytochrome c553
MGLPFLVLLGGVVLVSGCVPTTRRTDDALSRTGQLVAMSGGDGGAANACFTCHGLDGAGDGDATPRLAALDPGYLHKQLEDYATGLRKDDVMASIAKRLTPQARLSVATYYAGLPAPAPLAAETSPAPLAYAACVTCHGQGGEGMGAAGPAISGQPAAYSAEQLRRWRAAERRNDPRGVMRVAAARLSDPEIAAISAWLGARSAAPRPGSVAASASPEASASESPAASRAARHRGPPPDA